ncbi:MAG: DUF2240 family protein [Promethearchaeota archaeon]
MNLEIPRKSASDLWLYIWKIIDLPSISLSDLIFNLSFELFLFPPKDAKTFIDKSLEKKLLIRKNDQLSLSASLRKQFEMWQIENKKKIEDYKELKKEVIFKGAKDTTTRKPEFNTLLKAFLERGTINRAASLSTDSFEISSFDKNKGIIRARVAGSKETSYLIEIDTNQKILKHDCHDFQTRRSFNKKFCKHLAKLFLILKEKNEEDALYFLSQMSDDIDKWDFTV